MSRAKPRTIRLSCLSLLTLLLVYLPHAHADSLTLAAIAEAADRRDASAAVWSAALASADPAERVQAVRGLGRIGGDSVIPALLPLLGASDASVRVEAAFALAITASETPTIQDEVEQALLARLRTEADPAVRAVLLRALGNCGGAATQDRLRAYFQTTVFQKTVFQTQASPTPDAEAATLLADERAALAQAVGLLWSYRRAALPAIDPELVQQLLAASTGTEPMAEMAAFALARARKEPAVQHQATALKKAFAASQSAGARIFLLRALSQTVAADNSKEWLRAQRSNQFAGRVLTGNERIELQTVLAGQLQGAALRVAVAGSLRSAVSAERIAVIQTLLNRPADIEALRDLLQAQTQLQPADRVWLAPLLQPPSGAETVSAEGTEPKSATPAYADAQAAVGRRFRLLTLRGAIDIVLLPEAVYTAANFAALADRGFYNNTIFHRVIGNFVAQGGDPTATGEGGPGWRIREELSQLPHAPGYVGMATSGKDSAGSQFFINTGRNPHLDWHYTVFAKVEAGLPAALALRQGDVLLAVTPLQP